MRRSTDPIATHIAELLVRAEYLADLDERHVWSRWRAHEQLALRWAVDELCELYPGVADEVRAIADARINYRRDREAADIARNTHAGDGETRPAALDDERGRVRPSNAIAGPAGTFPPRARP